MRMAGVFWAPFVIILPPWYNNQVCEIHPTRLMFMALQKKTTEIGLAEII